MSKLPPTTPLERYLDGLLSDADRQRVEHALAANPQAQEQVETQRAIDDSLRRLFGPGDTPIALPHPSRRLPVMVLGIAAALALTVVGVWAVLFRGHAAPANPLANPLAGIYHAQLASGFKPQEVCTTRDKFAEWVQKYYAQALYPKAQHDGVEFVGWSYAPAIGKNSGVLLARAGGKEVIVVMDRKVLEKAEFKGTGDPGLHSFRKQFGSVVLYEVSPLDHESILPLLSTSTGD